ncbi:MAG TPA: hypothetical protein VFS67_08305 [Polyangiaceae bacterium]|nr:hypothetical protein [Polyangiaceae bacterium]
MTAMSSGLREYVALLDELLWRRASHGELSDAEEESFANALFDCRARMTDEEQDRIGSLVAERRASAAQETLGLVDIWEPPLRKKG